MSRKKRQLLRIAAPIVGALLGLATARPAPAHAQAARQASCESRAEGSRVVQCELRTSTIPAAATLRVDASPNGGVSVVASDRSDIQVVARVQASASSEEDARALLAQVRVESDNGVLRADGPENPGNRRWWSVSYEISVPRATALALRSVNGGVNVVGTEGAIEARTVNGGINLRDVRGSVVGHTTNGGIDVHFAGERWAGSPLELSTTNGGIKLAVPAAFDARLIASTVHGGINSDFPLTVQGRIGRRVEADLGSGGPTVRLTTTNGGIRLARN